MSKERPPIPKPVMAHRMAGYWDTDPQVEELFRKLHKLHYLYLKDSEFKKLLKKASRPIRKATRRAAPRDSGELRKSINILKRIKDPHAVYVGPTYWNPRSGWRPKHVGNHAHFTEYGVRGRPSKSAGWFKKAARSAQPEAIKILRFEVLGTFRRFNDKYFKRVA